MWAAASYLIHNKSRQEPSSLEGFQDRAQSCARNKLLWGDVQQFHCGLLFLQLLHIGLESITRDIGLQTCLATNFEQDREQRAPTLKTALFSLSVCCELRYVAGIPPHAAVTRALTCKTVHSIQNRLECMPSCVFSKYMGKQMSMMTLSGCMPVVSRGTPGPA